jgi:hypothetical protein
VGRFHDQQVRILRCPWRARCERRLRRAAAPASRGRAHLSSDLILISRRRWLAPLFVLTWPPSMSRHRGKACGPAALALTIMYAVLVGIVYVVRSAWSFAPPQGEARVPFNAAPSSADDGDRPPRRYTLMVCRPASRRPCSTARASAARSFWLSPTPSRSFPDPQPGRPHLCWRPVARDLPLSMLFVALVFRRGSVIARPSRSTRSRRVEVERR